MKWISFTWSKKLVVWIGVGVIVLVAGISYIHSVREQRLHAWFIGPCEDVSERITPAYRRGCVYDLQAYENYDRAYLVSEGALERSFSVRPERGEVEWVDGAAREELEALMRARGKAEGVTGATVVARLRSPTVYREMRVSHWLRIVYPPDGAVFPPNLCVPCVEWEDEVNDVWQVEVGVEGTPVVWRFVTSDRQWWFRSEVWRVLRNEAVERDAWIQVRGVRREAGGVIHASQKVRFRVSRWPVDNAVVYRLVPPPFHTRKTPDTSVRDLCSFETRAFLLSRGKYCFNCHMFSSKAGDRGKVGLQVRHMAGGGYDLPVYLGIYDIGEKRGRKVRLPFAIQMSTFMAWAPDESKLALSANQQITVFRPVVYETQSATEPTSDIAIYDVLENVAYVLPGASDPEVLELYPNWSPEGTSIVFCSTPAGAHPAYVHYDLNIVPFNGGRGGVSRAIPGASNNGKSNYYPRFSPDGKWLSFCQSDGGSLIKSSSDLYLLPGDLQGPARRMECNADYAADSWHSWSSNSHWLVFVSKRDDGIYARLYLTQIDDEGHASPAIRVPLREAPLASFNIPEFVAQKPCIEERDLYEAIRVEAPAITVQTR